MTGKGVSVPEVGTIVRGRDIPEKSGKGVKNDSQKFIWAECPDCLLARWVEYKRLSVYSRRRCSPCVIAANKRGFKASKNYQKD